MGPLISAADLRARIDDPRLRIADVRWTLGQPDRGRDAYVAGHLPGATFLDLETTLSDHRPGAGRHPLPEPRTFAAAMAARGIGAVHQVIAYDDAGGTIAARLWWMLDALGYPSVAVLDGGLQAWADDGGALTSDVPTRPPVDPPAVPAAWPRTIDRDELAARLGSVILVDLRAAERYRGETEPVDPVPGHIPTAVSAPSASNLGPDGRFLAPWALADRYARLGEARPIVVSCGSGVTACTAAVAMRAAGLPDPILYPGSFSDWSTAGMPVATGQAPGPRPDPD
jgi:thiosulfate/3-mercaptopyruvate sulfurtransferase